jgi:hypothetical protein
MFGVDDHLHRMKLCLWRSSLLVGIFTLLIAKVDSTPHSISSDYNPIIIGGVPLGSSSSFLKLWKPTFERYLFDTVGQQYDPPLNFSLIPLTLSNAFQMVDDGNVHFIYSNPSLYSCLEYEYSGLTILCNVCKLIHSILSTALAITNPFNFIHSPCHYYTQEQSW